MNLFIKSLISLQLLETLGQKLNDQLVIDSTLAGGCVNQVYKVKGKQSTNTYVLKLNDSLNQYDSTSFFLAESKAGRLSSHCSQHNIRIRTPKVLSHGENYILVEYIQSQTASDIHEAALQEELYKMHSQKFSFEQILKDNYLGRTQQINPKLKGEEWGDYFWVNRILFVLNKISDSNLLRRFFDAEGVY